jgi:hypothetical protein
MNPSRRIAWFLSFLLLAGFTRCAKTEPEVAGPPPEPMEKGEVRYFQFPADGLSHASGVLVLYGDLLLIEPQGLSDGMAPGVIECRAGREPIYVDADSSVRFESNAPLMFRVDSRKAKYHRGLVEVKITKREARH